MSFPAAANTMLIAVSLVGDEIDIKRFPVIGWMVAGGFLVPLTVVPPAAMPKGRFAITDPGTSYAVDRTTHEAHESEEAWIEAVSTVMVAGGAGAVHDYPAAAPEAALRTGPPMRDGAPGVDDPDARPKRTRRTKEQIAADNAAEAARKLNQDAAPAVETPAADDDLI